MIDDDGLLIGILSRSDLLDAAVRPDAEIRVEVEREVLGHLLGLAEGTVAAEVYEGTVTLRGHFPEHRLVPVVVSLCQGVERVVAVDAHLATGPGG